MYQVYVKSETETQRERERRRARFLVLLLVELLLEAPQPLLRLPTMKVCFCFSAIRR